MKFISTPHNTRRKLGFILIAGTLLCGASQGAQAASDGATITMTGKVVDNTCTVSTEPVKGDLGQVSLRDLTDAGVGSALSKKTEIDVKLTGCGAGAKKVDITAKGMADTDDTTGVAFKNTAPTGAANGVGVVFYETDGTTAFNAKTPVKESYTGLTQGDNTLKFQAAYVLTDAAKAAAGDFASTVTLTLAYN